LKRDSNSQQVSFAPFQVTVVELHILCKSIHSETY